ncbi:hypothetical protein IG631_10670 [Alternaria alternata]|nr:hypothetical protein IG631_10670 [Alternaria alternata]
MSAVEPENTFAQEALDTKSQTTETRAGVSVVGLETAARHAPSVRVERSVV